MSLAQVLSTYFTLNLLVLVSFFLLKFWTFISLRRGITLSSSFLLKLNYFLLGAIALITIMHPFFPRSEIFTPTVKLWSAESIRSFPAEHRAADDGAYLMLPTPRGESISIDAEKVSLTLLLLALGIGITALFRMAKDVRSLQLIRKNSFVLRKVGRVRILINDKIQVPFSSWTPTQADVVLPTFFSEKESDFRMAVAHELQHHRQGDTQWVYGLWLLKVLCAANPIAYLWSRWISELQEFACDETLVDQRKVESQQYARCLLRVAENANKQKHVPVCATGLVFLLERNLLKRRIEKMINLKTHIVKRSISVPLGLVALALMAGVAFASNGFVQDRRVTLAEAQQLAQNTKFGNFPVVVNDLVLRQLNRYIGTPQGRDFMRSALYNMEHYRPMIAEKLSEYDMPSELMAIPIIESGYLNLVQKPEKGWGAGIWMFIKSTARSYGLRVNENVDDRLDPELLTDAAMRFLKADKLKLQDWELTLLSFNVGSTKVLKAIEETGSRDAWTLIRAGYENDKDYLPKLMAAIIIMKNPDSVK